MSEITLKDIFNIKKTSIPVIRAGVVLMVGHNGAGKDNAISTVNDILAGGKKLPVRRGAIAGLVDGLGISMIVGRQTKRVGELVVGEIASRFDIAKIVDPQIKDDAAADAERIKALLRLIGVTPDPKHFYDLLGGKEKFEQVVPVSELPLSDVVEMASKIKRHIEIAARKEESAAKEAAMKAKAHKDSAEGVDLEAESNDDILRERYEAAVKEKSQAMAKKAANDEALKNAATAKQELEKLQSDKTGLLSVEDADKALDAVGKEVEKKREAYEAAEKEYRAALAEREKAIAQLKYAKQLAATTKKWEEHIAAAQNVEPITDEEIAKLNYAAAEAESNLKAGVLIRKAIAEVEKAKAETAKHLHHAAQGEKYRAAAASIDNVLSMLIKIPQVRIHEGRWIAKNNAGEDEFFGKLSMGEKCKTVIEIAAPIVSKLAREHELEGGIITAPQIFWEGLQPKNKNYIRELCIENDVMLLSAEATDDDELHAKIYEGE